VADPGPSHRPAPEDPQSRDRRRRLQREYLRYSGVGLEFAITVAVVGFLGRLLDDALGLTERFPLFLILGVFAGMAAGIFRLQLRLGGHRRDRDEDEGDENGGDAG